jgi:hypothetical protein
MTPQKIRIPLDAIEKRRSADPEFVECLLEIGTLESDHLVVDSEKYLEVKRQHADLKLRKMGASLLDSSVTWAKSGFKLTEQADVETRLEFCRACEFWDPEAFNKTGRCLKCGCSTWAKIRLATEKCPIGKW